MCSLLASESVEGSALSFEGIDDVQSSHGFSSGVFSVGHRVSDDVFKKAFKYGSGVVVDERGDSLDSSSSRQSSDGGFGDTLNGLLVGFAGVSLGADFAHAFSSFALTGHFIIC